MKIKFLFLCLFISIFGLLAFQEEKPKSLFNKALEKKMNDYRIELHKKCKEEAILEAELFVDSIVAVLLNPPVIEDTKSPPKPRKPNKPFDTLILDNREIIPILKGGN